MHKSVFKMKPPRLGKKVSASKSMPRLLVFLAAALFPFALGVESCRAVVADIEVMVGDASGAPGETNIEVPVFVSNTTGFGIVSSQITINYDKNRLSFASVSLADTISAAWGSALVDASTPGDLHITISGTPELAGDGKLIKIFFDIKPEAPLGNSPLILSECRFNDGSSILTVLLYGTFTVYAAQATPAPTASPVPTSPTATPTPHIPKKNDATPTPSGVADLAISRLHSPNRVAIGSRFNLRVTLQNLGNQDTATKAALRIYLAPRKAEAAKQRLIGRGMLPLIPPNSSRIKPLRAKIPGGLLRPGRYILSAQVLIDGDSNTDNNQLVRPITLRRGS